MTLNPLLRRFPEKQIDYFLDRPDVYVYLSKHTLLPNKNPIDFVLGYLYGEVLSALPSYYQISNTNREESNLMDTINLLNKRSVEIIDPIQRELEKT